MPSPYVRDTCTDAAGTALTSHTPEVGGGWTRVGFVAGQMVVTAANRLRIGTAGVGSFRATGVARTRNGRISCDLTYLSAVAGNKGVIGRMSSDGLTGYVAIYTPATGVLDLFAMIAGGGLVTPIATYALGANQSPTLQLVYTDWCKRVYVNGVLRIDSDDNSIATGTGFGLWGNGSVESDSTGMHLDNVRAEPLDNRVVCLGDSRTVGTGSTAGNDYPTQMGRILGDTWDVVNAGVGGNTTAQMLARVGTDVTPMYDASLANNVLIPWGPINDFAAGNVSAATAGANMDAILSAGRAAGFVTVEASELPASSVGVVDPAFYNAQRAAYVLARRASWRGRSRGFADVAADPVIGPDGAEANTTNYTDRAHLTDAGQGRLAWHFGSQVFSAVSGGYGAVTSELVAAVESAITPLAADAADAAADAAALLAAVRPTTGAVNDPAATTTAFVTTLASSIDDFYKGMQLVFTSGALAGRSAPVLSYNGTIKRVTLAVTQPLVPDNGTTFDLLSIGGTRAVTFTDAG